MSDTRSSDALHEALEEADQKHLIRRLERLGEQQAATLRAQIEQLDWDRLRQWIDRYVLNPEAESAPGSIEPAEYYPLEPDSKESRELYQRAEEQGEWLLRNGEVAAFTVAGGQGTRLGFDAPKGTFPISPVRSKSLFQLFAETILGTQDKYDAVFSWYIMTSPMNDEETREFFDDNECFGLDPDQIMFFPQGTLPAVDLEGRVLLEAPDRLALSPDGHGGSLRALRVSGALEDMRDRGIRHISYFQVDNPLVKPFDPLFLGLHAGLGSEMSSRCLAKTGPREKLGNFCRVDGRLAVMEYSDMPTELAEAVDEQGRLRFRAGSPAIHALDRCFVERITRNGLQLPIHRAVKKVPHIDENQREIVPDQPNAVKFETFVFDAIAQAENPLILEADRTEQFAPVKNRTGVDSVESCRDLMNRRAVRWLESAEIEVPKTAGGAPGCIVELSPRRFPDADDVRRHRNELKPPNRNAKEYYQ